MASIVICAKDDSVSWLKYGVFKAIEVVRLGRSPSEILTQDRNHGAAVAT
jgi:hypothetical protein